MSVTVRYKFFFLLIPLNIALDPSDSHIHDSFIPILRYLGHGFYLDQNLYVSLACFMGILNIAEFLFKYISGSLTTADSNWTHFRDYTRTVSKFILTDKDSESPNARISPSAFIRLARLQRPDTPLLPSLSDLVIEDADASIAHLDLLLTPSLKSLKASCIPGAHQPIFFCFLTAIKQEAPLLETLILGPGMFLRASSLQAIPQFKNLRYLELKHEASELPFAFFDEIGYLPKLEALILDARYVSSPLMKNKSEDPSVPPVCPFFLNSNAMDDKLDEDAKPSLSKSGTFFTQLVKLHVVAWLPVLEDLIHRITLTQLEDVSVTFLRLSYDELKVHLAKERTEREIRDEESRRRAEAEKNRKEEERMWREEVERKRINEEKRWIEEAEDKRREAEDKRREEENWWREKKRDPEIGFRFEIAGSQISTGTTGTKTSPSGSIKATVNETLPFGSIKKTAGTETSPSGSIGKVLKRPIREPARHLKEAEEKEKAQAERYLKELEEEKKRQAERCFKEEERLASLSFDAHTASFTDLLQKLCCQSATALKEVSISQLGGESFKRLLEPPTLPEEIFRKLLLLPLIESLEVKGWVLDSFESVLGVAEAVNLRSLLLPLDEITFGVSLSTLRRVAESCPKLEKFQCHIQSDPDSIPQYPIPATDALSHGLRMLSVGNSSLLPNTKQLYLIARHLYLLFPDLEAINTSEEDNTEQWATIDEFVKMFQTARMDDMNRPSSRSL